MNVSKSTMMRIVMKIRRRIPSVAILTLFSVAQSLLGVAFAIGSKNVIDSAIAGHKDAFLRAVIIQGAIILGIIFCNAMVHHLKERIHATLDRDWKKRILHDLLRSEYISVSKFHSSELLNRINNDVRILDDGVVNLLPNLASMATKLFSVVGVLIAMTPKFTFALLSVGLVVIIIVGFLRGILKGLHKKVSEASGQVSGIIQETIEKLLAVQAMDIAPEIERRSEDRLNNWFKLIRKRKNLSLISSTCTSVMMYAASFTTLVLCSSGLLAGTMTYGNMTAITQLVGQIQRPFVGLSGVLPQYISMLAAAERLQELDSLPKTVAVKDYPVGDLYNQIDLISADNLEFTYDRDKILDDTGFAIKKGSFCVIKGPSGTGKSTLLKLLLGIYQPNNGRLFFQCGDEQISIDGCTRKLFSYVPQGNLIFSGTLKENLLVVRPDASEEEINHAVYISAMDEYLTQLPEGLNTMLGESGAGLSEGQAQRLAIARAILGGAPILLLDECTSALDAKTEELVLERLRSLQDKTCIAVTHRPVIAGICDTEIQMDSGKISVKILM